MICMGHICLIIGLKVVVETDMSSVFFVPQKKVWGQNAG